MFTTVFAVAVAAIVTTIEATIVVTDSRVCHTSSIPGSRSFRGRMSKIQVGS